LLGFGILVFVVIIMMTAFIFSPAPQPKVSLTLLGFTQTGSNQFTRIRFTNDGTKPVWWDVDFKVTCEDAAGKTNIINEHFSGLPAATPPSSNFVMSIPAEYVGGKTRWRVATDYTHYKHRPIKIQFVERYVIKGSWQPKTNAPIRNLLFRFSMWSLDQLPDPKAQIAEASTVWLTNQPPLSGDPLPSTGK
jgi:hypothetical protein